ncbi:olfactory receptor 10A3-like [Nematolebias whitei]|uniref:olfactory receptor 10A3-like n=1 Tax=Nematolebias whitei TaxID=451745 RepID=UPI00189B54F3|nr:olfactory receptor 10A3-like [Nematolebias whitei]
MNSTQILYFILSAHMDTKLLKYVCFFVVMSLYVFIICSNVLLIVVICVNRSLHEPMYMFLCSLFVNELYGSTGLFPFLLVQILSNIHIIAAPFCFLQIYCIHTYGTVEFYILAVMSYDRYFAICHPLQYNTLMTVKKVTVFIAVSWLAALLGFLSTMLLGFSLQLCGNIINKVYCDNYSIVKLACSDTTVNNVYGLVGTVVCTFIPVILILYTYIRILKVCFSGSEQTRQKAVNTCTPHLASLLNYFCGVCFEILQSRFNVSNIPIIVRIVLSLYFLMCQPLINPLIYGLTLSKIRCIWKSLFLIKRK